MRMEKSPGPNKRFAPWSILWVLGLLTVIIFVLPSVAFAQNYAISQDCDAALVGTDHTVTATVTDGNGNPATNVSSVAFLIYGAHNFFEIVDLQDGVAEFTYTGSAAGVDTVELLDSFSYITMASLTTTWTNDDQDPVLLECADPALPPVQVGGRTFLNAKKNGALKIAICSTDGFDVSDVDLQSVQLEGVRPWRSHYKDSHLCPGGKDGLVDLVLKFKNREIVEALENNLGELADGDVVDLAVTGSLNDEADTAFGGEWEAVIIKKKGRMHWKKAQKEKIKEECGKKEDKKKPKKK